MSEGRRFPFIDLGQKHASVTGDFETLLELSPHASILVDTLAERVLVGNSKAVDLSLYTRAEFAEIHLKTLFPDWDKAIFENVLNSESPLFQPLIIKNLIRRDQTQITVRLFCTLMPAKKDRALLALEPVPSGGFPLEQQRFGHVMESLTALVSAMQETDFRVALNLALEAGSALAEADILALYLAQEQRPVLLRMAGHGAVHLLPDQLSALDLAQLSSARLWVAGMRPTCALQRAARSSQLSFLASAPVGQANALIGLVVVADAQASPLGITVQAAQLLGNTLTSIYQAHTRLAELQSEFTLKESHLRVNTTIEKNMREGVIVLDLALQVLLMNQSAESILGYSSQEITGQAIEKIIIGSQALQPALAAAQQGSATYSLGDVRLYRRNGDEFSALVRAFPVLEGENPNEIILLIQDLSEQEQIRLHAKQLEPRASLGEVITLFAHEVLNPINNISTSLQFMSRNLPEGDPKKEAIASMLQDCDRVAELSASVKNFSRPLDYKMETLDLAPILEHLLERLRPRLSRLKVQHGFHIEPNCPSIRGNLHALEQVFNNLINNSLEAMGENGGSLIVRARPVYSTEERGSLEVTIADTGPGIPKEFQERIFHPFYTTKEHGTGLGLPLAQSIITAHKGNITLDSVPGGTVFRVLIPAVDSQR